MVVVFNNNNYNRLQHLPAVHFWFRAQTTPHSLSQGLVFRSWRRHEKVCGSARWRSFSVLVHHLRGTTHRRAFSVL